MLKAMAGIFTVLTMLLNSGIASAGKNEGTQYPRTSKWCNKQLIRDIYDDENSELMDAIRKFYKEGEKHGWSDQQFCGWLRKRYDGQTEARFGECLDCESQEPQTAEVDDHREVVRYVVRERERVRPAPVEREVEHHESHGDGGGFTQNPFMGGLLGGALGGFLGAMLGGRMNHQQQGYFPPPQWGPGMPGMGMPGMPGMPGMRPPGVLPFPGAPGVLPLAGQSPFGSPYAAPYGQTNPWALPYPGGYGQLGAGGYGGYGGYGGFGGYGGYGGGYNNYGYSRGLSPGVLPLAPQSNFSVMGSIPQNHWNLINVGR